MSISLLFGCCQIETCARDLAAARKFMVDVLGALPIEQALARQIADLIPGDSYDVDHLDCGEAVFQINQPSPAMTFNGQKSVHQAYLDSIGPSVTNLNFYVDDYAHARELLGSLGTKTLIQGPSTAAAALADYGTNNTRSGAAERPFLFMGSRHLIGLDLEIMEPNFQHFTQQAVQFPAFVQPRPVTGDGNLRLQRLHIVVADLQNVHDNLVKLFAPASRSKPYHIREGKLGRGFRICLGGIEIEYSRPSAQSGYLADQLKRRGAGVFAIAFGVRDANIVLEKSEAHGGMTIEPAFDHLGLDGPHGHRIASCGLVGFDVLLEEWSDPPL